MQQAPYHADVADGPENGHAVWATCDDGVRIRVGLWPLQGARGTVLIFPGRTEYIEKYGPAARAFAARGFASMAIDWRGQGLAERMLDDSRTGHVMHFRDYQRDLAAALSVVDHAGLPRPFYLVAHSMGGAIGLRALMEHLPVQAAVFSAPMWGIRISPPLRPVARALAWASRLVGAGHRYAPGTNPVPYTEAESFDDNTLTTDPEMFAWMNTQTTTYPDLALGGPSMRWLHEALSETKALRERPSPEMPCLTFLGSNERIVDTPRIYERMSRWPSGKLDLVERGEHEVMMERAPLRTHFFDEASAHFNAHP